MYKEKTEKHELKALIEEGIQKVLADGKFQEYLEFYSRFHQYSLTNTLLVYLAKPNATRVAGMKQWNAMGRHIIEGSKAIMIFAPMIGTRKTEEVDEITGEVTEKEVKYIRGFCSVNVFDVSQTEGADLPECDICHDFGSDTDKLDRFIKIFGDKYSVKQKPLMADLGGYLTKDNSIMLNASKSEEQRLKTLIHEVAHGELGHFEDKEKTRAQKELEAEITGFIVARHFGVDSSEYSFGYLVSWSSADISKIHSALIEAYKISNSIIDQIEAAESQRMAS